MDPQNQDLQDLHFIWEHVVSDSCCCRKSSVKGRSLTLLGHFGSVMGLLSWTALSDSLNMAMVLELSLILFFQTELYHQMTLQLHLQAATLLFFLSFNVLGTMHNRSAKIIVC